MRICIKRSHFDDVHQKWGLVIFHGDEKYIKATSLPGEWVKFLNFDPSIRLHAIPCQMPS